MTELVGHVDNRGTSSIDLWQWSDGSNSVDIHVHRVKADVFEQLARVLGAEIQESAGGPTKATWFDLKLGVAEVSVFKE